MSPCGGFGPVQCAERVRPRISNILAAAAAATVASATLVAQVPGRNVNMISGTTLPDGDPFLQRQNEPSLAVSSRNPLHLLAGANDYRTVDLPGLPDDLENGDAWLGVYMSSDGGQTWKTTLLPGYPQDGSPAGLASPLHGLAAAADPTVRAGVNGLFFYSGIAFNRGPGAPNAVFVARFIDNNNKENGQPIRYLGTRIVSRKAGKKFLDKPWLAVDVPRGDATCTVDGQRLAAGNVYIVYTMFSGTSGAAAAAETDTEDREIDSDDDKRDRDETHDNHDKDDIRDKDDDEAKIHGRIMFSRSRNCGITWSEPETLGEGDDVNQGATIAIDPSSGRVFVAWRQFARAGGTSVDAFFVTHSRDGGEHFEDPVRIATITPFDQGTSGTSFRTNAYPTMTIDESGRVYVAWSARGFSPLRPDLLTGDGRIVLAMSKDGRHWTIPRPVDSAPDLPGHQIMPTLAYAAGKLQIAYYDLREDVSQVFAPFISDFRLPLRHTVDVHTAQAAAEPNPIFSVYTVTPQQPSPKVSQYRFGSRPGSHAIEQLQFNPPNLPMFKQGTVPFLGDYIDIAPAPAFVPTRDGGWAFNTAPDNPALFHVAWTDNRDVRPPRDGNWAHYAPPVYTGPLLDPSHPPPACSPGQAGMRNQNVYTSRITPGLIAGSPGNAKPLSPTLQRGFVVFAENATTRSRVYRFTIVNQPTGGRASFSQFPLPPFAVPAPPPLTTVEAIVPAKSLVARTVYATSTDPRARIDVNVVEIAGIGEGPVPGGDATAVTLNPDITNPDITNPDITNPDITNPDITNAEVVTPDITNPGITNPDITNPVITNPDITNPDITNVLVANPDITNPDITNPDITNPTVINPDITNPDITNPDITNGTITDVTWTVTNHGNTAAAYATRLVLASGSVPPGFKTQLVVHKIYKTPVVVDCELKTETQNQLVANVVRPTISSPGAIRQIDPNSPDPSNVTFFLAPGEIAKLTLRVVDPDRHDDVTFDPAAHVAAAVIPQEVNTDKAAQGVTHPPVALPRSATALAFATQPSDGLAGQPVVPAVQVRAVDLVGASVAGLSIALTLTTSPSGASLAGSTTALTNSLGIATFPSLRISKPGAGYQLTASALGVAPATSSGFAMTGLAPTACATPLFGKKSFALGALPSAIVAGDFNGDGRRDFAVGTPTGIIVFLQTSSGFSSSVVPVSNPVRALAAADTNGDGTLDLIVALGGSSSLMILRGDGSGGFAPGVPFSLPGTPAAVAIADFNGDGRLDAAVTTTSPDGVSIVAGDGAGGFSSAIVASVGTAPGPIVAGDFNGDGRADLAVGNTGSEDLTILLGNGNGGVLSSTTVAVGFGGPTALAFGDFNEDGIADLAVATASDAAVRLLIGDGAGHFASGTPVAGSATAHAMTTGDFTGDGHLDVALVSSQGLSILSGDGFGNLAASLTNFDVGGGGVAIAQADANADGRSDLIVAVDTNQVALLTNACGSAPSVTPRVAGAAGGGGWFHSDVTVTWIVDDPISGIGSTTGCGPTVLTAETNGQTVTCSATNGVGITTTKSATVKIDKTPPTVSAPLVSPAPNAAGWNRTVPVSVVFSGTDVGPVQSGGVVCTSMSLTDNTPPAGTVVNGACTDLAGNSSAILPVTVRIDKDPPSIVFGPSNPPLPPGGVYNRDVIVPYTITDPLSGVASVDPPPIYVMSVNGSKIFRVDAATGAVIEVYAGNFFPSRGAISPANGKLYVAERVGSRLLRMDQTGLNAEVVYDLRTAAAPDNPSLTEAPTFTPNGDLLFVSGGTNRGVWRIARGVPAARPIQLVALPAPSGISTGLAVTPSGEILAVDRTGNQVFKSSPPYSTASVFIATDKLPCSTKGGDPPAPPAPICLNGIAVDASGQIFVGDTDTSTRSVLRFSAAGAPLGAFVSFAAPDAPVDIRFGASGDLWVVTIQDLSGAVAKVWRVSPAGVPTLITPTPLALGGGIALAPSFGSSAIGTVAFTATSAGVTVSASDLAGNTATVVSQAVTIDKTLMMSDDFVVTTTQDSGVGSLRQAILNANAHPGLDTVTFNIPPSGAHTIAPVTSLPVVTDPIVLDATSQPGYSGTPVIELSGIQANAHGIQISAGGSTINGFAINQWRGVGIHLDTTGGNRVKGNYIGTTLSGNAAAANNAGVRILSPNNIIGGATPAERNVISGNSANGVIVGALLSDDGLSFSSVGSGSVIEGNYIGTNASGTASIGNGTGVAVGVPNVTIGGTAAGAGNLISGNSTGIGAFTFLLGNVPLLTTGSSLLVQGNRIGTNADGTGAIPNGSGINASAPGLHVGGAAPAARNIISGNSGSGINLSYVVNSSNVVVSTAANALIEGNYIGVDSTGTAKLPNVGHGISVSAAGATIGPNNVIAGNGVAPSNSSGIGVFAITGPTGSILSTGSATIVGNFIGTNSSGTPGLGNLGAGVSINTSNNTIGGTTTAVRNVISGNKAQGIFIQASAAANLVQNNYIGTNTGGTAALGNTFAGIRIESSDNRVVGNVISGGGGLGVNIDGATATRNRLLGNYIGTNATGTAVLGNAGAGVDIAGPENVIGGAAAGQRNVISGNTGAGIFINGAGATGNLVQGNYIGTDTSGAAALGNGGDGIALINRASNNTIGGTAAGASNVISGNRFGMSITGAGTTGNLVQGNFIGTDVTGNVALGNATHGINIFDGASGNTVGGTSVGARNVISANQNGILILSGASGNFVHGNFIGTDARGTTALGNSGGAVLIDNASDNTIGGTAVGARNVISGNGFGMGIGGASATRNRVQGNFIGTDVTGNVALGNATHGINISDGASGNTVGGTSVGARNVISANQNGILILNGANRNSVEGNFIGTNQAGTTALGNRGNGVLISNSTNNTIGGSTAAERNVISSNSGSGIALLSGATGNFVRGNYIGTNASGTGTQGDGLGNGNGVFINGASNNMIGGTTPGERNVISGNVFNGVDINASGGVASTGNVVVGNYIGTDVTGTAARPNASGVMIQQGASGNTVGGSSAAERNVISGNGAGVGLQSGATGNFVKGNYIGTNASGTGAPGDGLGNRDGVFINGASNNIIGGTTPGERNVIAGSTFNGVVILASSAGNQIVGNDIGTDMTGNVARANVTGVFIQGANNTVGGTAAGAGNTITFNTGAGVIVTGSDAVGNRVLSNSISSNGGLGIDLGGDGVTPNHPGGAIVGPNHFQNFPVITSATATTVDGTLNSDANATFTVQLFTNAVCDPTGFGQGQTLVASSSSITTDANGNATFSLPVSLVGGQWVTATTTDATGNTSEFSACRAVSASTLRAGFAYVVNCGFNCGIGGISGRGSVSAYSIDGTTGALTPVAGSPFPAGAQPLSVAVDRTGHFAYVTNASSDDISAYAINQTTGALIPVAGSPFRAGTFPASVVTR